MSDESKMSDISCRYYLRSKRRKLENGREKITSYFPISLVKRKNPIMFCPIEVLQHIFKFISFQELGNNVRLVNHKFKLAAEDLLNTSFKSLEVKLKNFIASTCKVIQDSRDDIQVKTSCRLLNLAEIVQFQYSIIMATIWRYVYNEFYRIQRCCMYAGLILDTYNQFIQKILYFKPLQIFASAIFRDSAFPSEVYKIIKLTKYFCVHFEKINEELEGSNANGCKLIDLLETALYCEKTTIFEKITPTRFSGRYCYRFHNSWFITFKIIPDQELDMTQHLRLMHLRLRRIVLAHTEMYMQQTQYEREKKLLPNVWTKRPGLLVYTGYGDVFDTFFCYGVMNDAAYLQKFQMEEDELELEENFVRDEQHLAVDFDITISCPLNYAPYGIVGERTRLKHKRHRGGSFQIEMQVKFPGASKMRLPTNYQFSNYFFVKGGF